MRGSYLVRGSHSEGFLFSEAQQAVPVLCVANEDWAILALSPGVTIMLPPSISSPRACIIFAELAYSAGVQGGDLVRIRSHQAQAVLTGVTEAITKGRDLNQLNSKGASWVRREDHSIFSKLVLTGEQIAPGHLAKRNRSIEGIWHSIPQSNQARNGMQNGSGIEWSGMEWGQDGHYTVVFSLQLHITAANGYQSISKLLLDSGADINVLDDLGYTPLHLASKFNQACTEYL